MADMNMTDMAFQGGRGLGRADRERLYLGLLGTLRGMRGAGGDGSGGGTSTTRIILPENDFGKDSLNTVGSHPVEGNSAAAGASSSGPGGGRDLLPRYEQEDYFRRSLKNAEAMDAAKLLGLEQKNQQASSTADLERLLGELKVKAGDLGLQGAQQEAGRESLLNDQYRATTGAEYDPRQASMLLEQLRQGGEEKANASKERMFGQSQELATLLGVEGINLKRELGQGQTDVKREEIAAKTEEAGMSRDAASVKALGELARAIGSGAGDMGLDEATMKELMALLRKLGGMPGAPDKDFVDSILDK